MANTKHKGSAVLISVGAGPTVIAGQRNCTVSISAPEIDATNKDDANATDAIAGRYTAVVTGDGLVLMDAGTGVIETQVKALFTAITTRATIAAEVALGAGSSKLAGTAIVTQWDFEGSDADVVLGAWTMRIAGVITLTEAA